MNATNRDKGYFPPTMKRNVDIRGDDFYPTPAWATYALIDNEKFDGNIWECACGDGAMSQVLEGKGYDVISTDLYDRGFGEGGVDFLKENRVVDNIITNPPYNGAESFLNKALDVSRKKVAFLLRLAFLEGVKRNKTIFSSHPPSIVWVFSERLTFYPKNKEPISNGSTAYAWFVWDKENMKKTELKWFPLGYRKMKNIHQPFLLL